MKPHLDTSQKEYRYEIKYPLNNFYHKRILNIIYSNPCLFKEIYQKRIINNIYFDTWDYKNYNANIFGLAERKKVRVRWYGNTKETISSPVLEMKIRKGHVGCKESYPLKDFSYSPDQDSNKLYFYDKIFGHSDLPEIVKSELKTLRPTLFNRYERQYFISSNKLFRLTLDSQLTYNQPYTKSPVSKPDPYYYVIEIKFTEKNLALAQEITDHFPFRVGKNSKYINGVEKLYGVFPN